MTGLYSIKTKRIVLIPLIFALTITNSIILGVTTEILSIRLYCYVSSSKTDIENRTYHLEILLGRDFMPITPPNGEPLSVVVRIKPNDSINFPKTLDVRNVWVIKNFMYWRSKLETLETPYGTNYLVKAARGGPKWGPGITVDVLVQLVNNNDKLYYMKVENQMIERYD